MKRNFLKLVAVAGVLVGGSLTASAAERISVKVPFSFVLAGLEFQPGHYTVDQSESGVLTVSGEGRGAFVTSIPAEFSKSTAASSLRFINDGHEYHLVGVQMEGESSRSIGSPSEHKLSLASR
jgi:hypothetical protein